MAYVIFSGITEKESVKEEYPTWEWRFSLCSIARPPKQ